MNTAADLKRRLLRLFPVSVVKSHFSPVEKVQAAILDELSGRPDTDIVQFAFANLEFTRQHVFLFEHQVPLNTLAAIDVLPGSLISNHTQNNEVTLNYLFEHTYVVHANHQGQYSKLSVNFRQPIRIVFEPDKAWICLTILERNPAAYLPNYDVFTYKRAEDDKHVIDRILSNFLQTTHQALIPLDLTIGVKALWHADTIDARSLKFKRANSIVSEKMDQNFTFKTQYPNLFAEVMAAPLKKHVFHFINGASDYGDFECDPSEGAFSFNRYPTTATQIKDVISTIIAANV